MNKSYRSIYNEALGAWVAVSELDTAKGKSNSNNSGSLVEPRTVSVGQTFKLKKQVWASIVALGFSPTSAVYASTIQSGPVIGGVAAGGSACTAFGTTQTYDGYNYTSAAVVDGSGNFSLVGGCSSNAGGFTSVTNYGAYTKATGDLATAVGFGALAGRGSAAVGYRANASGDSAVSVGALNVASGANTVAIGSTTTASGTAAIAIGQNAKANSNNSVAIGRNAQVNANAFTAGTALGENAVAVGSSSALGAGATATGIA